MADKTQALDPQCSDCFRAGADFLEGKPVDPRALISKNPKMMREDWGLVPCLIDIGQKRHDLQDILVREQESFITNRQCRAVYAQYLKLNPTPDAADFYAMTTWLFPDDPLSTPAANLPQALTDPTTIQELLKPYEAVRWPELTPEARRLKPIDQSKLLSWTVASAVRQLMLKGNADQAHDLALRYHAMTVRLNNDSCYFANHLVHLTELEEQH